MQANDRKIYPLSLSKVIAIIVLYYGLYQIILPIVASAIALSINPSTTTLGVVYQFLIYLFTLIPVFFIALPLFTNGRKLDANKIIYTLILGIIGCISLNILFSIFMSFISQEFTSNNQIGINQIALENKYLYLLLVTILAPMLEEIVFRGVIFKYLRSKTKFIIAALISSFLFGFIHVLGSFLIGDFIDMLYLFLYGGMGVIFAFAYEYNDNLTSCILFHSLYNLLGSLYLFI